MSFIFSIAYKGSSDYMLGRQFFRFLVRENAIPFIEKEHKKGNYITYFSAKQAFIKHMQSDDDASISEELSSLARAKHLAANGKFEAAGRVLRGYINRNVWDRTVIAKILDLKQLYEDPPENTIHGLLAAKLIPKLGNEVEHIEAQKKREIVLSMRAKRISWAKIGKALGIKPSTARDLADRSRKKSKKDKKSS